MMEKEARTNKAGADLDKRNRNWGKVDNHMLETAEDNVHGLSGAVIVESGSNSNGDYIKFGDGTMICYANTTFNATSTDPLTVNMPINFSKSSMLAGGKTLRTTTVATAYVVDYTKIGIVTQFDRWYVRVGSVGSTSALPIGLWAIGRWK